VIIQFLFDFLVPKTWTVCC